MKIAIVGPGAIGCLFGGLLSQAGHVVHMLDRHDGRARTIDSRGLCLDGQRIRVHATADPRDIPSPDIVCVCVKTYDTQRAAVRLPPLLRATTMLVSLQNGVGNAEKIADACGHPVVCAVTAHGATLLADGEVQHAGKGPTSVSPFSPGARPQAEAFVSVLQRAGMDATSVADVRSLLWSKLIVNAAINPVSALEDVPNGAIAERVDLFDRAVQAANEGESVARAARISLLYAAAADEVRTVCRRTRRNVSSMRQDLRRGKCTEVDAINGAIVREGKRLGVPVPVNAGLVTAIHAREGISTP